MNRQIRLKDLLASKRWEPVQIQVAQAGSKTARDGYTLGWTERGSQVDVLYNHKTKRHSYIITSKIGDGSDMELTVKKYKMSDYDIAWTFVGLFGTATKAIELVSMVKTEEAKKFVEILNWIKEQKYECGYCQYTWSGNDYGSWPCPNCGGS